MGQESVFDHAPFARKAGHDRRASASARIGKQRQRTAVTIELAMRHQRLRLPAAAASGTQELMRQE